MVLDVMLEGRSICWLHERCVRIHCRTLAAAISTEFVQLRDSSFHSRMTSSTISHNQWIYSLHSTKTSSADAYRQRFPLFVGMASKTKAKETIQTVEAILFKL